MALLSRNDFVLTDPTPTLPDTQLVPNLSQVRVGWFNQANPPVIDLANPLDSIVGHYNGESFGAVNNTLTLLSQYQAVEFRSDIATKRWMMMSVSDSDIHTHSFDVGAMALITAAPGALNTTLTYDPILATSPNVLFATAAFNGGTRLTALMDFECEVEHSYEFSATIAVANNDVIYDVVPVTSKGNGNIPPVNGYVTLPRALIVNESRSASGRVAFNIGDTLDFVSTELGVFGGPATFASIIGGLVTFSNIKLINEVVA